MTTYRKNAIEAIEVPFNFSEYLATLGNDGIAAYTVYADPPLSAVPLRVNEGDFILLVSGGVNGQQYNFGMSILTAKGAVKLETHRLRVQGIELNPVGVGQTGIVIGDDGEDVIGGIDGANEESIHIYGDV